MQLKKIYLLLFVTTLCFAQGENDNWYFGYGSGLNFSTTPPTPLYGGSCSTLEGISVISSPSGQLLFYTDGETVWNREHQVMTNGTGLTGGDNTQQVIILPHPANNNLYYVFTMGHVYMNSWGGGVSGPGSYSAYSIINMNLGNTGTNGSPLGEVTSTKNLALLDELGQEFTLRSENVDATLHADNQSYWILYPNDGKLYSYRLDENGFDNTPVVSNLPAPIDPVETHMHIRVSPALSPSLDLPYTNFISISRWPGGLIFSPANFGIRICSFDNNTGQITSDYVRTIDYVRPYATEFSGSGTILYSVQHNGGRVHNFDLLNPPPPFQQQPLYIGIPNRTCGSIQRATNGEIYIAFYPYNDEPNAKHLGRIVNQESFINASVELSGVFHDGSIRLGLPPLIPIIPHNEENCWENLTLGFPETSASLTRNVSSTITTNNNYTVSENQDIELKAGETILLLPNTYIESESFFLAEITECISGRPASVLGREEYSNNMVANDTKENLLIYPNPSTDRATISLSSEKISTLIVYTSDGKTVYSNNAVNSESFILDTSEYKQGIYIIVTISENGNQLNGKLIKN